MLVHALQSDRFFNALKGHGALCRLVVLPFESHGYTSRESIMHVLWETDRWLQKYCSSNSSDVGQDVDKSKEEGNGAADSKGKVVSGSGGGGTESSNRDNDGFYSIQRSLLW